MAHANPCTIIPKPSPSENEGYTMGGLGLGLMEVRKAWLCGWYERLKELTIVIHMYHYALVAIVTTVLLMAT